MNWQQHLILFLALSIALVGATLATWPVVADAPWEDDGRAVILTIPDDLRCAYAMQLRDELIFATGDVLRSRETILDHLLLAQIEVGEYCAGKP